MLWHRGFWHVRFSKQIHFVLSTCKPVLYYFMAASELSNMVVKSSCCLLVKKNSLKFLQLRKCNLIPDLVRKEKKRHNGKGKRHSFPTILQWCCQFPEMGFLNRNLELFSNYGKKNQKKLEIWILKNLILSFYSWAKLENWKFHYSRGWAGITREKGEKWLINWFEAKSDQIHEIRVKFH